MTPREFMARHAAGDPEFLAHVLAQYCEFERVEDDELARRLECPVESLTRLRLCLRPRVEQFWTDVQEIASTVGADPDALAAVVRHADALSAVPQGGMRADLLMAARDRGPEGKAESASEGGEP